MAWSVTVTKLDTGRTVLVVGVGGAGVGAWACPVNPKAHSRAAVRQHSLVEHLIALSPLVNERTGFCERDTHRRWPRQGHKARSMSSISRKNETTCVAMGPRSVCPVHSSTSMPVDR